MNRTICWMMGILLCIFLGFQGAWAQEADNGEIELVIEEPAAEGSSREVILESADRIKYDSLRDLFEAFGNVRAIQGKNLIETQEMEYDLEANTGLFRGGVVVTRDDTVIRSLTMEGDFDQERYLFLGGAELAKEREEDEGTSTIFWKAETITFDGNTEEAWSEEAADITWKDVRIQAQRVYYYPENQETGEPERMILEEEVIILEKEREIVAGSAVYYLEDERLEADDIIRARFIINN